MTNRDFLLPDEVAKILHMNPHQLRLTAREQPYRLGFPVIITGHRVRIPKKPFMEVMGYASEDELQTALAA